MTVDNTPQRPHLGAWLASNSAVVTELAVTCRAAWVLLDMEHGYVTEPDILPHLLACRGSPTQAVIRVPSHEPALMGRLLDKGADGIMVPHVDTAEQAEALIRATKYAPEGVRGYARSTRSHGYGLTEPTPPSFRVFAQIESSVGIDNVESIASVQGISVLFLGPADLKHDLAASGQSVESGFDRALHRTVEAARKHGKAAGIFLRDPSELRKMIDLGYTWIAIDSDLGILRSGFRQNCTLPSTDQTSG